MRSRSVEDVGSSEVVNLLLHVQVGVHLRRRNGELVLLAGFAPARQRERGYTRGRQLLRGETTRTRIKLLFIIGVGLVMTIAMIMFVLRLHI